MTKSAINKKKSSFTEEERSSVETAELVFESFFESKQELISCASLLAESIKLAHQSGPECWSLTLYPKRIRLNVGPSEVLVLSYDNVFLPIDGEYYSEIIASNAFVEISDDGDNPELGNDNRDNPEPDIGNPILTSPGSYYPSVPGSQIICFLPPERLDDCYPILATAHRKFIELAAEQRKKTPWRSSFSPGVVSYLNQLLNISLPLPTYVSGKPDYEMIFPDEVTTANIYPEGAVSQVLVNVYERDPKARKACIEHYGLNCHVCNFNFETVYGERGKGFIHIHHLRPISAGEYEVNPIDDLRPVCPNCHAMIHRFGLLSIEELKVLMQDKAIDRPKTY